MFLRVEEEKEFLRIYAGLAENGIINAEVYEEPFNGLLAVVTDRNGVCWVLSYNRS